MKEEVLYLAGCPFALPLAFLLRTPPISFGTQLLLQFWLISEGQLKDDTDPVVGHS